MSFVPIPKRLFVATQFEEIVFFRYVVDWPAVNRAISGIEVALVEVCLATDAVKPLIILEVYVTVVVTRLEQLLDR